jgi:putative NIF3 family GTP cyclohydrolase 1 type 2
MQITEIIQLVGGPAAKEGGCDRLIAGRADQVATSVVVTFLATRAVLERAVALGANLVITHEPTYFQDERHGFISNDPIADAKRAFIEQHRLTIWRCHDWWHRFPGDGILIGMSRQLGWSSGQLPGQRELFDLPQPTTLSALAADVKSRLGIGMVKLIGRPDMPLRRVGLSCGCPGWERHRAILRSEGVDALVCGELREWETCEYVRDSAAAGHDQGLIVLGHCNSEEAGMRYLAEWLQERISVRVHFVPAGDPFYFA